MTGGKFVPIDSQGRELPGERRVSTGQSKARIAHNVFEPGSRKIEPLPSPRITTSGPKPGVHISIDAPAPIPPRHPVLYDQDQEMSTESEAQSIIAPNAPDDLEQAIAQAAFSQTVVEPTTFHN